MKVDYVIHAAALSTVWGKWKDFYNSNVIGTENVIKFCLKNNVKRLVYVSSPSVYSAKYDRFDIKEEDYDKKNKLNFYIKSKILADDYVLIHMTGKRQSKQDYINSVLSGELNYYESIHESIEVNIDRDRATIIGKTKTLASPFGFGKSWWKLRQDVLLEKVNDTWIIKQSKASSY